MSGFKSATKRKRELAKQDKRQAKDQRRAQRRAARSGTGNESSAAAVVAAVQPAPSNVRTLAAAPPAAASTPKPLTLAEAVERWRNTKVAKPPKRG
jgi:hypothetical protein